MGIDTTPLWDGIGGYQTFGVVGSNDLANGVTAIGQVFNSGNATSLSSFDFFLSPFASASNFSYETYLFEWDDSLSQPSGIPLAGGFFSTSGLPTFGAGNGSFYGQVNGITGTVTLTPNTDYILLLTTLSIVLNTGGAGAAVGAVCSQINPNPYGGNLWFFPTLGDPGQMTFATLLFNPWVNAGAAYSFAFKTSP
jgi:hypothetical protein